MQLGSVARLQSTGGELLNRLAQVVVSMKLLVQPAVDGFPIVWTPSENDVGPS
jgi:hypothetical protein